MSVTSRLSLPYIAPQQAQKQVSYNAAMELLDSLVQLSALSRTLTTPPATPAEGDIYIVPAAATAAWAGRDTSLAVFRNGGWNFVAPQPGCIAYVQDVASLAVFAAGDWKWHLGAGPLLDKFGIHATPDLVNRFAVASEASLFTHDGAGHMLKVNKARTSDTASLLLQTGYSGRAEIGLSGDDQLHIKASPDGASWAEALTVSPTGQVSLPTGQLTFPATPNPSPSPTTLDDYREGTWVPSFGFSGGNAGMALALAVGRYTKIGRSVTVSGCIALSAKGTSTGLVYIGNLPFPAVPEPTFAPSALFGAVFNFAAVTGMVTGLVVYSPTRISLYVSGGGNSGAMDHTKITDKTAFHFSATYDA